VVLAGIGTLVLVVLELWPVLALIVILLVAVVFATKDVVLDYVMGLLILIEGQFFMGDYVVVPGHAGIEGVVEEIGLRRTVLRDAFGAAHAVSNGLIRLSSNRTRLYSAAVVDVFVLHAADLDRAIAVAHEVADGLGRDEGWTAKLDDTVPVDVSVVAIGMDGALVRLTRQVQTGLQGPVASELRRRVAAAFVGAGIATGRFDAPLQVTTEPARATAPAPTS
jgi:small conductance mechanosensitive channel